MAIRDLFKSRKERAKVAMAYKRVFNTEEPSVRIVLKDMCAAHSVFDGGFDPDPYIHALQSGERNAVLRILTLLQMSLEDIIELAEEEE